MTKIQQILTAVAEGVGTSGEIAARLRFERRNVSVTLCRLAGLGLIERAGVADTRRAGRPFVRWRLRRRTSDMLMRQNPLGAGSHHARLLSRG